MAADAMSVETTSVSIRSFKDSSLLACKYDMDPGVHEYLKHTIFLPEAIGNIVDILNDASTIFYGAIAADKSLVASQKPLITAETIHTTNVRFATFHVRCTGDQDNPLSVYALPTFPAFGYMCINKPHTDEMYRILIQKLTYDLLLTGEAHTVDKCFILSLDVYLNRERDASGVYHRDVDVSVESQTKFFSIEIFSPPDVVVLGTEIFEADFRELPHSELGGVTEADLGRFIQGLALDPGHYRIRSHRFLVKDGTVVFVNNFRTVHATPICQDTRRDGKCTGLFLEGHRLEQRADSEAVAVVGATIGRYRSFIRCWISDAPLTYLFGLLTRGTPIRSLDRLGPFPLPTLLDRRAEESEHSYGGSLKGGGKFHIDLKIMNNDQNVNLVINNINDLIEVNPSEISKIQKQEEQYMLKQMGGKTRKHKKLHKKSRNKK